MSGETWDGGLADLSDRLARDGAIDPAQAEQLQRLLAEVGTLGRRRPGHRGIVVRTAVALTPQEQQRFRETLARRFGPGRQVAFEVDPKALGGVWLRVGDRIIDGSLRGRLVALRKQMAAGRT